MKDCIVVFHEKIKLICFTLSYPDLNLRPTESELCFRCFMNNQQRYDAYKIFGAEVVELAANEMI